MRNTTETQSTQDTVNLTAVDAAASEIHPQALIKQSFKRFLQTKEAKPWTCTTYGTRYPGECQLIHFLVYAILRGKFTGQCVHSQVNEKYQSAMQLILHPDLHSKWKFGSRRVQHILETVFSDSVTPEMWQEAVLSRKLS